MTEAVTQVTARQCPDRHKIEVTAMSAVSESARPCPIIPTINGSSGGSTETNPPAGGRVPRAVYDRQSAERSGVPQAGRHLRYSGDKMTPEYRAYTAALSRCHDSADEDFADYGGRGIAVCARWRAANGFDAFADDLGPRPSKSHTLGRIDNALGYQPGNVRWETWTEQANNRRSNHRITIDGVTKTAAEWARHLGGGRYRQMVTTRIGQGWHPTAAVLGEPGEWKAAAHKRLGLKPDREAALGPKPTKAKPEDLLTTPVKRYRLRGSP